MFLYGIEIYAKEYKLSYNILTPPTESNMEELNNMPAPVREVHEALLANARQNWDDDFGDTAVYTRPEDRRNHETNEYEPTGNWIVGCNFEGWGSSMIFKGGVWYYRSHGVDRQMAHGHEEALGNANCFFTG